MRTIYRAGRTGAQELGQYPNLGETDLRCATGLNLVEKQHALGPVGWPVRRSSTADTEISTGRPLARSWRLRAKPACRTSRPFDKLGSMRGRLPAFHRVNAWAH